MSPTQRQFRVLYRQFLFRIVDLELLAAQGDMGKLLGQLASLLVAVSVVLTFPSLRAGKGVPPEAAWGPEFLLVSTTMLVVGLFAVLSWDATLVDRRDVLVLSPLPVRVATIVRAKVAACAAALGLTVALLHVLAGLAWPMALASAGNSPGMLGMIVDAIRPLLSYWVTMAGAGAFVFCSVLTLQGLALQLLPRGLFLRVSAFLQLGAFALLVGGYFLEPMLARPDALSAPASQVWLAALPPYWFFGLFHALNGTAPYPVMTGLAVRAGLGLAAVCGSAALMFLLAHWRMMRKVVEEPDILPVRRGRRWLPQFGTPLATAIVWFSARTLLRSRRHRVILSFYLGIALAAVTLYWKSPAAQHQGVAIVGMASGLFVMFFAVLGTRVVFAIPFELAGNWTFRLAPIREAQQCLGAVRQSLAMLAVAPALAASAMVLRSHGSWVEAAGHLSALALLGMLQVEMSLHEFHKIPFTCSYMPGKSNFYYTMIACAPLALFAVNGLAYIEWAALQTRSGFFSLGLILSNVLFLAYRRTSRAAASPPASLRFEEHAVPVISGLSLHRDGAPI